MKWTDFVVGRPVAILMAVLVVILLGVISLTRLNLDLLPKFNFPVAVVVSSYSGAGPEEVEKSITKPLEDALGTVQGLKSVRSISQTGSSLVIVEFEWGTDMNFAALDMREKIDLAKRFFPEGVERPMVLKMDPNAYPIVQLAIWGGLDEQRLKEVAENTIKKELERLEGVASVSVTGGQEREIQVLVSPEKLRLYGLGIDQVVQALRANNLNQSGGWVEDAAKNVLVRVTGELGSLEELRQVAFQNSQGAVVHIGDVARVADSHKDRLQYSLYNGQPAVGLNIQKQTNGNTVTVSREVKKALQGLTKRLPQGVRVDVVMDQADYIQQSINNIYRDMFLGGLLAFVVIFLFLRSLRSTFVISTAIPISIIATFVLLFFNKMTLNIMTLGGLSLGIGRMVDDSIVVLDSIYRHRQEGKPARDAAIVGSGEVTNAVVASTLTTVAVFFPIAFVRGIASEIFGPLALTVGFALLASLAVALTVIPLLCSRVLAGSLGEPGGAGKGLWGRVIAGLWLERLINHYRGVLGWALGHRRLVALVVVVTFVLSLALFPLLGFEFIPNGDEGLVNIQVELPKGSVLEETSLVTDQVLRVVEKVPEVRSIYLSMGGSTRFNFGDAGGLATETASISLRLVDLSKRRRSASMITNELREGVGRIPGARFTVASGSMLGGGSDMMGAPVQVDIKGDDLKTLERLAGQVEEAVRSVPGAATVRNSLGQGRPEVQVEIDREKAARYALSVAQVGSAVSAAVQGKLATSYRVEGSEYDTTVRLEEGSRHNLQDLAGLTIASPLGFQVSLADVATLVNGTTPVAVQREGQVRLASVTADLSGRSLGAVMQDVRREVGAIQLPPGYQVQYAGQNKEMMESFTQLGISLLLAVVLVYMIMAAQFESLFHPFVIMFSVPVSLIGVVTALLLTRRTFSVITFMGVIMLLGIVLSNAIVLVDYINTLRRRGMGRTEAILKAGPTRLRPILMTATVTILAMLPLALGLGEGTEMQAPMATAVIGGLLTSTVLTLVLVPVVYTSLEDLGEGIKERWRRRRRTVSAGRAL